MAEKTQTFEERLKEAIYDHGGGAISSRWTVDRVTERVLPVVRGEVAALEERIRVLTEASALLLEHLERYINQYQPDEWYEVRYGVRHDIEVAKSWIERSTAELPKTVAALEERIRQLERDVAGARLAEFELIKRERPHDPLYWDMHHERELRAAAGKKGT